MLAEQLLGKSLVDKEIKGELYARLICILARDYLLQEKSGAKEFCFSQLFSCSDFLKTLTGRDISADLSHQVENSKRRTLRHQLPPPPTSLTQGYMNFNHFFFIEDDLDLDLDKAGMTKLLRRLLR